MDVLRRQQLVIRCSEEATINALVSSAAFYRKVRQHSGVPHADQQQPAAYSVSQQTAAAPQRGNTYRPRSKLSASAPHAGPQAAQQVGGIFVGAFRGQTHDTPHAQYTPQSRIAHQCLVLMASRNAPSNMNRVLLCISVPA